MSHRCTRCGRPLSDPKSVERGMGAVCAALADDEAGEKYDLTGPCATLPTNYCFGAATVVVKPGPHGAECNVPLSVVYQSPTGWAFGYGGSGPADLALNILNAFVPPGTDGEHTVPCVKGHCSRTAWILHQQFVHDFITRIPPSGGEIPSGTIRQWIDYWRNTLFSKD